jgi:hypothetical protein
MKLNFKSSNYLFWIFLALLLKGIHFWSHVYLNYDINKPLLGHYTFDSNDYYGSMNNFYMNGVYSPDERMPGIGIIYLLFRLFFEHNTVLNILLVLQWIVTSVAAYVLCLLADRLSRKQSVFYILFFICTITHYLFVWDTFYLSEGFCISVFIFALWYLAKYYENPSNTYLFLSGTLLGWCCFMRPVFFLFYAVILLFLLVKFIKEKQSLKNILIKYFLVTSVFILFDSLWIIRNYKVNDRLIILNDIEWYSQVSDSTFMPSLYLFMESWGGDLENELSWFELEKLDYTWRDTVLPKHMYTSEFNKDSLILVKKKIKEYKARPDPDLNQSISLTLQRYTASVKNEKPFLYYFGSGFIFLKKLFLNDYGNFKKMNSLPAGKRIIAYTISILFYFLFFTGCFFSLIFFFRKESHPLLKVLTCVAFLNLIYIAFGFRTPEFRYVLPSTLIYFCFTAIAGDWVIRKVSARR